MDTPTLFLLLAIKWTNWWTKFIVHLETNNYQNYIEKFVLFYIKILYKFILNDRMENAKFQLNFQIFFIINVAAYFCNSFSSSFQYYSFLSWILEYVNYDDENKLSRFYIIYNCFTRIIQYSLSFHILFLLFAFSPCFNDEVNN